MKNQISCSKQKLQIGFFFYSNNFVQKFQQYCWKIAIQKKRHLTLHHPEIKVTIDFYCKHCMLQSNWIVALKINLRSTACFQKASRDNFPNSAHYSRAVFSYRNYGLRAQTNTTKNCCKMHTPRGLQRCLLNGCLNMAENGSFLMGIF